MARGGTEFCIGKRGVEEDDKDPHLGGGGAAGVNIYLKSCGSVGTALRRGNMGGQPPHGKDPRGVP